MTNNLKNTRILSPLFQYQIGTNYMHTIKVVHLEDYEINLLRLTEFLDDKGHPIRMTHLVLHEIESDTDTTLSIYENVAVSTLHASQENLAIAFDRYGNAFEIPLEYMEVMQRSDETLAV